VDHAELRGARRVVKGVMDRLAAALGLLLAGPLLLVLMAAVRLDSPGPALFRQQRVGRGNDRFTMLKLRTMTVDAEERREDLVGLNESDGALFKIRNDPRITRVGRMLRRFSLDELPQLVNVLRGEMSLVGPRPPLPSEVADYEYDVRRRLAVKPGLTGLWQVSGRSDLPWDEAVRLDLRYVDNWSPLLDLQILFKTGRAVLSRSGAY
jgi:exopolysaccharide biosynthesis polyprenyl glycosylphosphotransferase